MPSNPTPAPAAGTKSADTSRARRMRFVGILALAALAVFVAWRAHRGTTAEREPASAFEYIRDQALAGDGSAGWRTLLPEGRKKYVAFLKNMSTSDDVSAQAWRRTTGISKQAVATMAPADALSREYLAVADTMLKGAKVYRTDRVDEDTALINILAGNGDERSWMVRRVNGIWMVSDPWPTITAQGYYTSGTTGRPVRMPEPGTAPRTGPGGK